MPSINGIQFDGDDIDAGILDGLTLGDAANRLAAVIGPLSPTPAQYEAFIREVTDGISGCAAEIHHEIGGHVVEEEIESDELLLLIDGQELGWYFIDCVKLHA